jgi:hypothetical protein
MHAPATGLDANLAQRFQKPLAILIIQEYRLPPIPAIHESNSLLETNEENVMKHTTAIPQDLKKRAGVFRLLLPHGRDE